MLIEAPIGNVLTDPIATPIDWLDLTWQQCLARALKKHTRGGEMIRVVLRLGVTLRHGDLLRHPSESAPAIAVNVLPGPVLVARPPDLTSFLTACYELGNLHVPLQLDMDNNQIITILDGPVQGLLERLGVPVEMQNHRFEPGLLPSGQVAISDGFSVDRPLNVQPDPQTSPLPKV